MGTRFAIVTVISVVLLSGCIGMIADGESKLDAELEGEGLDDIYESTTDPLDPDETDSFKTAITGPDDEHLSDAGVALLKRIETVGRVDQNYRDAVVDSVVAEETVDKNTNDALDHVLNSPEVAVLAKPLADEGYDQTDVKYLRNAAEIADNEALWTQAESVGLLEDTVADGSANDEVASDIQDSTGDGLLDGKAKSLDLNPDEKHSEVGEVATTLTEGQYGPRESDYLNRVADISEYQGNEYEVWAQAEQLGLLDDAVADGEVSDKTYWAISNDASNRLLNGMEEEFGTDPEVADTAGDGYPDHLKWGPLRDLGFDVTPDEPDVIVEIDSTTNANMPSDSQLEQISDIMANEPNEPINVHFKKCDERVDPIVTNDSHDTAQEHKQLRGIGARHIVMVDNDFADSKGRAWWHTVDHSWGWVDDTTLSGSDQTNTIAHELGHLLGLHSDDFDGIDSHEYSRSQYNSVMNYNVDRHVTFSTGEPFDDYEEMAKEEYGSRYESIDELETMWEEGSVDDITC